MSEDYGPAPLAEFVTKVVGGGTPSRTVPTNWHGLIPWVSVKDMDNEQSTITATQEYISKRALRGSAANLIPTGTPIVCTRMAVGRAAVATVDVAINQDLKALFPARDVDSRYLLHGLSYLRPRLDGIATGSTVRGIQVRELLAFELLKPDLSVQQRIAAVLDAVDREVQTISVRVSKLIAMRRGLIDDLMSRDDWPKARLDSVASVERGKFGHRPRNDPAFLGGPYPFIQTGDVAAAHGGVISEASQSLSAKGAAVSKAFPAGTIAVTIAANIADTALLGVPMYFPDSVVGVVVRPPNGVRFVELMIRVAKPRLEARAPQSAQRNINLQDLRPLVIGLPPPPEQERVADIYDAASAAIHADMCELKKLKWLKQGLVEDLVSGRVRMPIEAAS